MVDIPAELQEILARPRSARFHEILRVGHSALEEKDLQLARAAVDHVITRAEPGSGDLARGLILLSMIMEAAGNKRKSEEIMARVCQGKF